MAIISGLVSECPDMLHPKLSYTSWRSDGNRFKDQNAIQLVSTRIPNRRIQHVVKEEFVTLYTPSVGRNHYHLSFDDGFPKEPFWVNQMKEAFWALKSLSLFLVEQPSQLKYIEWPSFQSTLKTASLTLVLVGLLIIALSSVDSALCYLLVLLSRRAA